MIEKMSYVGLVIGGMFVALMAVALMFVPIIGGCFIGIGLVMLDSTIKERQGKGMGRTDDEFLIGCISIGVIINTTCWGLYYYFAT